MATNENKVLERLFAVIDSRRGADPKASYTASLLAAGKEDCARKVGEEAIETMVAALQGNRDDVIHESADLLYHLLVLWACVRITPEEVWAELARREGTSGIAEKESRGGPE
ncbi:MAG: phosphoribosyl-ATP diphosphatase [Alphaproteobacteria bacterium]